MKTLGDALQDEITRVRDEVMPAYIEIGGAGAFALAFMRDDLDKAVKALAEGDGVACLAAHKALKGYHT